MTHDLRAMVIAYRMNQHMLQLQYKSSLEAEMGDRGHNRHGPKRGGLLRPFRGGGSWVPV